MIFNSTPLSGSYTIDLKPFTDDRGWFGRYYCKEEFKQIGHTKEWVQMNHSASNKKGTIRGLHFQISPYKEIKMVRCIAGEIFDVIVDLRKDSPTFLQWFGVELSAQNKKMIYIPEGFAHGFQCLTDHCELLYHHSEMYQPKAEAGIRFDDSMVHIKWPLPVTIISERDAAHPLINEDFKGV
ncbi:dTDP-4-dehydrorhamnose 3,5-epimerase [Chitinophagaceae bacterium IBVUCB2]|nr:dTDP-4-dehydrorhamnose 3,5-epimerase [Chitinophagaceae bacterium IBVUCB2]